MYGRNLGDCWIYSILLTFSSFFLSHACAAGVLRVLCWAAWGPATSTRALTYRTASQTAQHCARTVTTEATHVKDHDGPRATDDTLRRWTLTAEMAEDSEKELTSQTARKRLYFASAHHFNVSDRNRTFRWWICHVDSIIIENVYIWIYCIIIALIFYLFRLEHYTVTVHLQHHHIFFARSYLGFYLGCIHILRWKIIGFF